MNPYVLIFFVFSLYVTGKATGGDVNGANLVISATIFSCVFTIYMMFYNKTLDNYHKLLFALLSFYLITESVDVADDSDDAGHNMFIATSCMAWICTTYTLFLHVKSNGLTISPGIIVCLIASFVCSLTLLSRD